MKNAEYEEPNVPILGMEEFRKHQLTVPEELLYNELNGARQIQKSHKHDFFMLILFDEGEGIHTIDFRDYPIANKQLHLLFPGQVHRWDIGDRTIASQLMLDRLFFERIASYLRYAKVNYTQRPLIPLSEESFQRLKYEFDAIKKELKQKAPLKELIHARASVIASIISQEAENQFEEFSMFQSDPRITKFNSLIEEHYKTEKGIPFYAEQLHISANYLNVLCKKKMQASATQLIQQRVLLEAKRLLQSTDLSIKEIAYELNFVDHAYFSNFFKNQTGITPSAFREKG